MPIWLYDVAPYTAALIMVAFIECIALIGLLLVRHLVVPRLRYHEGTHEAVSGTVQAIGVFYGITVGLIAVAVWNTNSNAADLVSREAAAIGSLFRDVSGYPSPAREELRMKLRVYTEFVINDAWPAQKEGRGQNVTTGVKILNDFQSTLFTFEPKSAGETALHSETLRGFNQFIDYRRLRIDAVSSGLSPVMWAVIWVGAIISIGVAYFYNIPDLKLHAILVALMAAFLAMVLFMIVINDKPFYGNRSISSDPFKLILENQKTVK
jgi:hypothetical protein